MRDREGEGEGGAALAAAILALAATGMLVAAAFFVAVLEQRAGDNARRLQQAFALAEAGIGRQVAHWDAGALTTLPVHPADQFAIVERRMVSGAYRGRLVRLNQQLYLIDVTATDSLGAARQRLGLITRLTPPDFRLAAPLITQAGAQLLGNVRVEGADHTPPSWTSCAPPDSAPLTAPVAQDTAPAVMARYAELTEWATIRHAAGAFTTWPTVREGACDRADPSNWGDGKSPTGPCRMYFPIVHIQGDARLQGGQGQGVLLIDGDLTIEGPYEFFGLAVVRGRLIVSGSALDVRFWGGVVAQSAELEALTASSHVGVTYSKCALDNGLSGASRAVPLGSRGWMQLF